MLLPRVKRVHDPYRRPDGSILIGTKHFPVASELQDEDGTVWDLLTLMDGTRDPGRIVDDLRHRRPEVDDESVNDAIESLIEGGFVEDAGIPAPPELSPAELDRYAANIRYLSWVDTTPRRSPYELQRRLKRSRVTVVGIGGTGCTVAMSLAAAGIGALRCVDFDVIERGNLNRQILYSEADVGAPKVPTAVRRLKELNPHVLVEGVELRLDSADDVIPLMTDTDLLVLCADLPFPEIAIWTSDAAMRTGTPWMMCFYAGPMIVVGMFVPDQTPCFRCLLEEFPEMDRALPGRGQWLYPPAGNAVMSCTAGATGNVGALEAINYLTGLKPQTVGRIVHINLMMYDHQYTIEPKFRADCPACLARQAAASGTVLDSGLDSGLGSAVGG